jgi:hypothetical protein
MVIYYLLFKGRGGGREGVARLLAGLGLYLFGWLDLFLGVARVCIALQWRCNVVFILAWIGVAGEVSSREGVAV